MKRVKIGVSLSFLLIFSLGVLQAQFVSRQGMQFMLNGRAFYFAGANCYDLFTFGDGAQTDDPYRIENYYMDKARIDAHMARMANDGVTVLRVWGFSHETWHGFEPAEGQYYEPQFMLFDYIMESAKNHGIKIAIVLENYWEAYGGIDKRLQWEGLGGGTHANRAQFFVHAGCRAQYKNYAQHFVNRINHYTNLPYKNDPTLFAWELMNEPRFQDAGENSTGTSLRAWVDEMAGFIKGLDPNHMVGIGIEGHALEYGFGGDEGNPFIYIHQSPYVDYTTAHPYPTEEWAQEQLKTFYGTTDLMQAAMLLIKAWAADSATVGKPLVLGEFNYHNVDRSAWWTATFNTIEANNIAGSQFWWYTDRQVDPKFGVMEDAAELSVFKAHSDRMKAKSGPVSTPTPTGTPTQAPTPTPTSVRLGDANGDTKVDINDALIVARYSAGLNPSGFILANGDVTKDGSVNINDAMKIAQYAAGIITGF